VGGPKIEVYGGRNLSRVAVILTESRTSPSVFFNLISFRHLIIDKCLRL